jgi:hypothetical protein
MSTEATSTRAGRYVTQPTRYKAFIPAPLPPSEKPRNKIYPVEFKLAPWLREGCRNQKII